MLTYRPFVSSLILLSIVASAAPAQVNVEKYLKPGERRGLVGHIEFDLAHKRGNVDLTELDMELNTNYSWQEMATFVVFKSNYGWQGGERFSDEALTHARHVFRTSQRVQPEIFSQVDYSRPRLLDYRSLAGGGLRFIVNDSKESKLLCGTSLMGEHERYDLDAGDSHPDKVSVLRWSSYLSANFNINERVGCAVIAYVQPRIDEFDDIRMIGEAALIAEMIAKLSLVVSVNTRYDSRPPDTIKTLDSKIESGLVWAF